MCGQEEDIFSLLYPLPVASIKQSVSISVDLNDPACQQRTHRRVVSTERDKVRKAILGIIKEVLSRY